MIARIRGTALYSGDGSIIVESGGIGYKVRIPDPLVHKIEINNEIILYTELIVRQDLLQLYGFESPAEADMFRILISVSHIGPQTGLSIISRLSIAEICDAILLKKPEVLSQVQGLGKKGAERIILELQNKVSVFSHGTTPYETPSSAVEDALLALQSLGYSRDESITAIQKVQTNNPSASSSSLVKEALIHLRKK